MRPKRSCSSGRAVADQTKHRDRLDPMRQIDLILLEDAMRRGVVTTNSTARSFQLAALLLVGACVLLVLAHDMARRSPSIGESQAMTATERSTLAGHAVP
jgi:hypothetical protein